MLGLNRELVELKLPIRPNKKPIMQMLKRYAPEVISKIKDDIERMLRNKFIRPIRYVEWLTNIVPIIKKNETLRVCIDFRELHVATPKDEYPMHVVEMLVDSASGFECISILDGYYGYNQIYCRGRCVENNILMP